MPKAPRSRSPLGASLRRSPRFSSTCDGPRRSPRLARSNAPSDHSSTQTIFSPVRQGPATRRGAATPATRARRGPATPATPATPARRGAATPATPARRGAATPATPARRGAATPATPARRGAPSLALGSTVAPSVVIQPATPAPRRDQPHPAPARALPLLPVTQPVTPVPSFVLDQAPPAPARVIPPARTRQLVAPAPPRADEQIHNGTRTYAVPHRTIRSESVSSISTIDSRESIRSESLSSISSLISSGSDRLPTVLEIIQGIRGLAGPAAGGNPGAQRALGPGTSAQHRAADNGPPESASTAGRLVVTKMTRIIKEAGTCTICQLFMRTPYITQCGHACCSGCLRTWFEGKLAENLSPYRRINHLELRHPVAACQFIPRSDGELARLKTALQEHHVFLRAIFRYKCPICRETCTKALSQDFALKEVLSEARIALGNRLDVDLAPPEGHGSTPPFAGLFLIM